VWLSRKGVRRPVTTSRSTLIGVRLLEQYLEKLDDWIEAQRDFGLTRPEAPGRLVESGLNIMAKEGQEQAQGAVVEALA
jgi:hypothetical protein